MQRLHSCWTEEAVAEWGQLLRGPPQTHLQSQELRPSRGTMSASLWALETNARGRDEFSLVCFFCTI